MTNEFDYYNSLYKEYGNPTPGPIWQYFPPNYPTPYWQIPPQVDPYFPQPAVDKCTYTPDTTPDEAGYKINWIDFENGSKIIALVEPEEPKDGYTMHYNPADYYHLVEYSEDMTSTSITFVKKPKCWGKYPMGHMECTGDCRLQAECRKVTYPHGKSDDNDLPYADEDPAELEPEDMPERIDDTDAHPGECDHIDTTETCDGCGLTLKATHHGAGFHGNIQDTPPENGLAEYWRRWAEMMRSNGLSAMDIARTGSYTHEELDKIAEVLEGGHDGEEDETQEPWYRESLDKSRRGHNHSS